MPAAPGPFCDQLFVYGTLRRGCQSPMDPLLEAHAEWMGPATYQGSLYLVDYYPGAVPSDKKSDMVHGEIYRLREPDVVLKQLDNYEGCGPEPEWEYIREIATVCRVDGAEVLTWLYRYKHPVDGLIPIRDGDYVRFLSAEGRRNAPP